MKYFDFLDSLVERGFTYSLLLNERNAFDRVAFYRDGVEVTSEEMDALYQEWDDHRSRFST